MSDDFRTKVLTEVLKLINEADIKVDGQPLAVFTSMSNGYDPSLWPWLATDQPQAPDEGGAEFDVVTSLAEKTPPVSYRYRIELIET